MIDTTETAKSWRCCDTCDHNGVCYFKEHGLKGLNCKHWLGWTPCEEESPKDSKQLCLVMYDNGEIDKAVCDENDTWWVVGAKRKIPAKTLAMVPIKYWRVMRLPVMSSVNA